MIQESSASRALPERWHYPFFGSMVEAIRNHLAVDRSRMNPEQHWPVASLSQAFFPHDGQWVDFARNDSKVLYRPQIVKDLEKEIEDLFAQDQRIGLMVKGPHGIGKTYSLVNLTRYLLSSNKYLVTMIPNCKEWSSELDFCRYLLGSVGVDHGAFRLIKDASTAENLEKYYQ